MNIGYHFLFTFANLHLMPHFCQHRSRFMPILAANTITELYPNHDFSAIHDFINHHLMATRINN